MISHNISLYFIPVTGHKHILCVAWIRAPPLPVKRLYLYTLVGHSNQFDNKIVKKLNLWNRSKILKGGGAPLVIRMSTNSSINTQ